MQRGADERIDIKYSAKQTDQNYGKPANEIDQCNLEIVPVPLHLGMHLKFLDAAGAVDVV
jgi:hypothetical protein